MSYTKEQSLSDGLDASIKRHFRLEGSAITGIKTMTGGVYHIPAKDVDTSLLTLCGEVIQGRSLALRFEDINNPNLCKHCSMKAIKGGA